jgi:hypothetical protein
MRRWRRLARGSAALLLYASAAVAQDSVRVDGKPVAKVHRGQKFEMRLPGGHHSLAASKFRTVPAVKPIDFLFEAGTQYFVQLDTQQLSL